jgi:peptidoglycan hydrolase-like protein with peptidoglycan-binding domain
VAAGLACCTGLAASTAPPKKKVTSHTAVPRPSAPRKSGAARTAARGKAPAKPAARPAHSGHTAQKAAARPAPSRFHSGQAAPTPDRYKEIQEALARKGYLHGDATGVWNQDSTDALRRFQQDQNLQANGKLDSLSIIALGLGPKY